MLQAPIDHEESFIYSCDLFTCILQGYFNNNQMIAPMTLQ